MQRFLLESEIVYGHGGQGCLNQTANEFVRVFVFIINMAEVMHEKINNSPVDFHGCSFDAAVGFGHWKTNELRLVTLALVAVECPQRFFFICSEVHVLKFAGLGKGRHLVEGERDKQKKNF